MRRIFSLLLFAFAVISVQAQDVHHQQERIDHLRLVKTVPYDFWDVAYVQEGDFTELYRIPNHPAFDSLLTPEVEQQLLSEINQRRREIGKDTLYSTDYIYVWKPYFDWLENEDPHYRVVLGRTAPNDELIKVLNQNIKDQNLLPFRTYCINDTLVIQSSADENLHVGDMITSINGTSVKEYLKYYYNDRYLAVNNLLLNYNNELFSDGFDVTVMRDDKELDVRCDGLTEAEMVDLFVIPEEYNTTVYSDANCGYIQIKEFYSSNSRLIKIVAKALKSFKDQGLENVIIDVRRNPGGSGSRFDELLSLFINKPSIDYLVGQKLRVSSATLGDYDFLTEDMIGRNVDIPKDQIVTKVELDNRKFVDGLNFYLLVSEDTGSVAASFANILQYNDAVLLVGEPLKRNAVKYGEILMGSTLSYSLLFESGVSTMEFDEHTKAVDGVLMPDISIPYVAREYMTGKDAVLEKLLEIIRQK